MAMLFLDDDVFLDKEKWKESKDNFVNSVNKYIETHYTGDDSEQVYALFNPAQVQLLQNYFKGFSVEMYKELNGTVELQIQKRNEKVKEKINKIGEFMGGPINLEDWVYDGMVDAGKNAGQKCDLCPRPVRYAHFAVNKKTSECLRFGCNCAADFFNMDKGSLASMRTIQAQTLKDIKKIACIVDLKMFNEYYKYLGGHTGKAILEGSTQGLKDLMSYVVKWDSNGKIVVDSNGDCPIKFGDGSTGVRSLQWVKEHIISCLNADLDEDDIYSPLEDRILKRLTLKQEDKNQINTTGYVVYALKFVDLGLPIPESLMKKLNSVISKSSKQHHPDYTKYAQELLISHNLAKSSLLQKAFTDFIVNYLASSMGAEIRDPEPEYWGVRGVGTFYKTVLLWETAMIKLINLKEFYSLVSKGLITEEEFNKHLRSRGIVGIYRSSDAIKAHMQRCLSLFMTRKEVIRSTDVKVVTEEGYSKYTLKGVSDKISLCERRSDGTPLKEKVVVDGENQEKLVRMKKSFNSGQFTPDTIPSDIGLHHYAMQEAYKALLQESIKNALLFLQYSNYAKSEEDAIRYLCALEKDRTNGSIHVSTRWRSYNVYDEKSFKSTLDSIQIDEDFYNEMYEKYKGIALQFLEDARELQKVLGTIYKNLSKPILVTPNGKINASNINSDYDNLVNKEEKTNKDYFMEYCDLLIAKRGNKGIQQYIYQQNLFALTVYKQMEPYADMLKEIQEQFIDSNKNVEEKKLYGYLSLDTLKEALSRYLNTPDMDTFIKFIAFILYTENVSNDYHFPYDKSRELKRVLVDTKGLNTPLQEKMVTDKIDALLPKLILDNCLEQRNLFDGLYEKYKALFLVLKNSKGYIKFKDYYLLLNEKSVDVEDYLKGKDLVSCDTFSYKVDNMFAMTGKYNRARIRFNPDIATGMDKLLEGTCVYEGVNDIVKEIKTIINTSIQKQREEERRIERENRIKGPYLDTLKTYLKEHIDFFEVDVNEMRKKYPSKYGYASDVSIRQKEALKNITFQKGYEESARFIEELELYGKQNWSEGVEDIISEYRKTPTSDYGKQKIFAEALRAEMYNHKLIYNHFDVSYKVFKNLETVDLTKFEVDEIVKVGDILKHYYVFKSQIDYIVGLLEKYGMLTVNYSTEVSKIPEPVFKNIKDIVDSLTDKPDSTGLTGIEKAQKVKDHNDFGSLPTHLQDIVSTVCKFKRCTDRQLKFVNEAFAKLGLGTPDAPKVDDTEVQSTVDEKAYTELAKQIISHPMVAKAPDLSVKIATTVSKTGRCSEKQAKHLDKAKVILGL